MTCLDDRRLVDLHFGDGTAAECAHVASCDGCAARVRVLARDLGRIDTVLRSTPAPRRAAARGPVWRWAAVAVAAALALTVALGRIGPTAPPTRTAASTTDDDVLALADELSDALTTYVAFDDEEDEATARRSASSTCTWGDPLLGVGCEQAATLQIAWR